MAAKKNLTPGLPLTQTIAKSQSAEPAAQWPAEPIAQTTGLKLHELEQEYMSLLMAIEDGEGEITPELEQALQIVAEQKDKKLLGYHYVVVRHEGDIASIDREMARLKLLKEQATKRVELLKNHMLRALMLFGEDTGKDGKPLMKLTVKYGDSILQLSTRRSESVSIEDEDKIPAEYWRRPPVPDMVVDKTELSKALKAGEEIPGASLSTKFSLVIK